MKPAAIVAIALVALLATAGCGDGASTVEPEPTPIRLDAPQRRAIVQQTSNKETMFIMGQSADQTIEEDLRYTMDIDAADAGGDAAFTATIDFFSLDMESDLLEAATPGRMDPTSMMIRPVNEALRAATDLSYGGTLSPDGSVHELSGLDELKAAVHEKLATRRLPVEFTGTTLMEDVVEELFNEETVELTLEQILLPRPLTPLTEGHTWTGTTKINFGIAELPADVEFTVRSATAEGIVVRESVTFAIDIEGVQALRESLSPDNPFDATVSGNGGGTYQMDPASGWVTHYTQTLTVNGKYDFDGVVLSFTNQITRTFETFAE
jgi:hypothetical protein